MEYSEMIVTRAEKLLGCLEDVNKHGLNPDNISAICNLIESYGEINKLFRESIISESENTNKYRDLWFNLNSSIEKMSRTKIDKLLAALNDNHLSNNLFYEDLKTQRDCLLLKGSYSHRSIIFQKVVYELLKERRAGINQHDIENISYNQIIQREYIFTEDEIKNKIISLGMGELYAKNERFIRSILEFFQRSKESVFDLSEIIEIYEKQKDQNNQKFKLERQKKRNTPFIQKIKNLEIDNLDLKTLRTQLLEIDSRFFTPNNEYGKAFNEILSGRFLPSDDSWKEIIKKYNVDERVMVGYLSILERISIKLGFDNHKKELVELINGELCDSEYDFIFDLESEGITLDSPEGQALLAKRCVDVSKIRKFYEGRKLVNSGHELNELLNDVERELVEDLDKEGLSLDDQEAQRMISERNINIERIKKYFELFREVNNDLEDNKHSILQAETVINDDHQDERTVSPTLENQTVVEHHVNIPETKDISPITTSDELTDVEKTFIEILKAQNLTVDSEDTKKYIDALGDAIDINRIRRYYELNKENVVADPANKVPAVSSTPVTNSSPEVSETHNAPDFSHYEMKGIDEIDEELHRNNKLQPKRERFFDRIKKYFGQRRREFTADMNDLNTNEEGISRSR